MMPVKATPRYVFTLVAISCGLLYIFVSLFARKPIGVRDPNHGRINPFTSRISSDTHRGAAVMPKLGNETAKAELGRASWKYFHTVMARFPDSPTIEESVLLSDYIHLFQRLYPCGECAEHFGKIIDQFPPQVMSRSSAATWACHVHNEVNKSLNKDIFDCSKIGEFYDCGCAEDEETEKPVATPATSMENRRIRMKEALTGKGNDG